MAWNLESELNKDISSEGLFNSLPSKTEAYRKDELTRRVNAGGPISENLDEALMPDSPISPAFSKKQKLTADSLNRQLKSEESGNVLDSFEPPAKASPENESPYTMGQMISEGYGAISQIQRLKAGRTGRSAREVAREKALDDQGVAMVYGKMQEHLAIQGYDPNLVTALGVRPGGGLRQAKDIDRLFEIQKNGLKFQDENGEVVVPPDSDWETVLQADKVSRAMSLRAQKPAKAEDTAAEIAKWQGVMKSAMDAEGNVLEDRRAEYEKAASEIDLRTGKPQGTAAYFQDAGRILKENKGLSLAATNNVSYRGTSAKDNPLKVAENTEKLIQLVIDKGIAPTREELPAFIETGSPFLMDVKGLGERVVFPTNQPNQYKLWDAANKNFAVLDLSSKKPDEAEAESDVTLTNRAFKAGINAGASVSESILNGVGVKKQTPDGKVQSIKFGRITDEDIKNWKATPPITEPFSTIPGDYRRAPISSGVVPMKPRPNAK